MTEEQFIEDILEAGADLLQLHLDADPLPPVCAEPRSHKPGAAQQTKVSVVKPSGFSSSDWLTAGASDGGLAGRFGAQSSGPAQEGEDGTEAAGGHRETQTGPGTAERPAIAVIHISWQTVDEGGGSGEVIGHTGCIRTQRDGAKDP